MNTRKAFFYNLLTISSLIGINFFLVQKSFALTTKELMKLQVAKKRKLERNTTTVPTVNVQLLLKELGVSTIREATEKIQKLTKVPLKIDTAPLLKELRVSTIVQGIEKAKQINYLLKALATDNPQEALDNLQKMGKQIEKEARRRINDAIMQILRGLVEHTDLELEFGAGEDYKTAVTKMIGAIWTLEEMYKDTLEQMLLAGIYIKILEPLIKQSIEAKEKKNWDKVPSEMPKNPLLDQKMLEQVRKQHGIKRREQSGLDASASLN